MLLEKSKPDEEGKDYVFHCFSSHPQFVSSLIMNSHAELPAIVSQISKTIFSNIDYTDRINSSVIEKINMFSLD